MNMAQGAVAPATPHPLVVTYQSPALLKPDARNARTHPKRQLDQIVASINSFGFTNPILTDANHVIIAGHGRWVAMAGGTPVLATSDEGE